MVLSLIASLLLTYRQEEPAALVRVCDTGAGELCAIRVPSSSGFHYLIYDGGHFRAQGAPAFRKTAELIPVGSTVDWLIVSHTDSDHLGAIDEICGAYTVKNVVWPENPRTTQTWKDANGAHVYSPDDAEVAPGKWYGTGGARITFIDGHSKPPSTFGRLSAAERNNAGSVVVRFEYGGRRVLLTGDAVGRHIGDPDSVCIAEESEMVKRARRLSLRASVLIAPHHGGDNASSTAFIKAVKPSKVVFSCGHEYEHPRDATVQRYLALGLDEASLFRTDLQDDEGPLEWGSGRVAGSVDPSGDDDVDITLRNDGTFAVEYRN